MVRTRHYCEAFMEPVQDIIGHIKNTRLEMVRMAEIVEKQRIRESSVLRNDTLPTGKVVKSKRPRPESS